MLRLEHELIRQLNKHASRSYPEECCGFLFGSSEGEAKNVRVLHELQNSTGENRSRRYLVTPEQYREAESRADRNGLEILGLYHSHPDHPSRPSQFDTDHALPWWSYVIIAVEGGIPSTMSSWILLDDRGTFKEEAIEVMESKEKR